MIDTLPSLAKRLAPELTGTPVYVVDTALFDGIPCPNAIAWTEDSAIMGASYVAALGEHFCGPGVLIALDLWQIAGNARPGRFDACVTALFLHELAHALPRREIEAPPISSHAVRTHKAALERSYSIPSEVAEAAQDVHHDWRWIRRCAHLFHRATTIPVEVYAGDILHYPERLSPLDHYLPLLASECDRLRSATFDEIENEPAPVGLIEYFTADLNYHS